MRAKSTKFEDDKWKGCPKCGLVYAGYHAIMANFGSDRYRPDGLAVYCRACKKGYNDLRAKRANITPL